MENISKIPVNYTREEAEADYVKAQLESDRASKLYQKEARAMTNIQLKKFLDNDYYEFTISPLKERGD